MPSLQKQQKASLAGLLTQLQDKKKVKSQDAATCQQGRMHTFWLLRAHKTSYCNPKITVEALAQRKGGVKSKYLRRKHNL